MGTSLEAISPVDGRYSKTTAVLQSYFSEYALFKYRLRIEIEYLIELSLPGLPCEGLFSSNDIDALRKIYLDFSLEDALKIKEIEQKTNHDIKALEYFIKERLDEMGLSASREWVHFGLTSQDINNTAIPLSLKEASEQVLFPAIQQLIEHLNQLASDWREVSMLARTHGQPASPTSLGKEVYVFVERLELEFAKLKNTVWAAKFGGATGNFNAHHVAFPQTDWVAFANQFLSRVGLYRSRTTTQIEHYDQLASYCHNVIRIHSILIDLCRDVWTYISMEYFRQKVKAGETGSSAMPHKVNPIDFENAEGNLGYSNAILGFLAEKLPVSRLQRDLTDSTVLRNIGMPISHSIIAIQSVQKGLGKLLLNQQAITNDLNKHAAVVAEAIQTILRRESYPNPYEALKELTRGKDQVNLDDIRDFVNQLDVSEHVKQELLSVTPSNYTGIISY
jgi:adenylosuccinate lyase